MRRFFRALWRVITFPFRMVAAPFVRLHHFFDDEPEDIPLTDVVTRSVNNLESVFEHIDALRRHIFRALIAIAITTALSFAFAPYVLAFLARPLDEYGGIAALTAIRVTEGLSVYMRVSLLMGFTLAFPYIAFEVWLFAAPGLRSAARKFSLFSLPVVVLFFLGGMAFSYWVFLPPAIKLLWEFGDFQTQWTPSDYYGFVTSMLFWIGIIFEFPLIIYVLASIGLVTSKMLKDQWKLALVIEAVLAALITPTTDPVSMAMVWGPMVALYFFSVFLAFLAERGRVRRSAIKQPG